MFPQHEFAQHIYQIVKSKHFGRILEIFIWYLITQAFISLCRNAFHESLKQIGSVQHQGNTGGLGTYETIQHFNDIKEHLHTVKRDVEHLVQRSAQVRVRVSGRGESSRWNGSESSWLSSPLFAHTESCWEGREVPRGASHAFLLIHRSFCRLHRRPVGPVLLLHHVQVRHRCFVFPDPHVCLDWNNSGMTCPCFLAGVNKKQLQRSSFDKINF